MRVIFRFLFAICLLSLVRSLDLNGDCLFVDAIPPVFTLNKHKTTTALFTPFNKDMQLDLSVVSKYARHLSENGIYDVLVAATVGEGISLNLEERKLLLDAWISAGDIFNINIIMQIGGALTVAQIHELARYSEQAGADGIMTLPELYYSPTTVEQLVEFVKGIADNAKNTPIFYFDQPAFTGVELNMVEFFKRASCAIPTFAGLHCEARTAITVLENVNLKNFQSLLPYTDMGIVPTLASRVNGTISSAASIYPELVSSMVADARNGDWESAIDKQEELNRKLVVIMRDEGETTQTIAWLKTALEIVTGIKVGGVRDPIPKTTTERQREIEQGLSEERACAPNRATIRG